MSAQPKININEVIQFSELILRLQNVTRIVDLPNREARENDVEHSYHLAIMAWYLNSAYDLGYNTDRLLRYALVHDLAEAYAGDISCFDLEGRKGKDKREKEALVQMEKEMPAIHELTQMVHEYEECANPESRFIFALDKIMPLVMIYMQGGKTWRELGLTIDDIHVNKVDKVKISDPVNELYYQLKSLFEADPKMFEQKQDTP